MFARRFYEPQVAQASYLIGCAARGEAVVIDPNRDVGAYIDAAARENLRISHVTETHIHADFVSGARELATRTGALLCLSDEGDRDWKYQFATAHTRLLHDGDHLMVGNVRLDVLHTPGHTPEHLTFLVTDTAAADQPIAALTGDFLFVGDVGRPDLLERAANMSGTMEAGARTLWRSLARFQRFEDWLQIWPGHGAGSACGKGISAIPHSTLGYERRFNWAFKVPTEDAFVEAVLAGQPEPPKYFATMKRVNKEGPAILDGLHAPQRLPDDALAGIVSQGGLVVDTRPATEFAAGHVPGTINIPLNASFTTWAGWLVPYTAALYLITDDLAPDRLTELVRALALIGLDTVRGVFAPSAVPYAAAHGTTLATIAPIDGPTLDARLASQEVTVVDVRGASEWATGHLPGALHVPLGYLAERAHEIPGDRPVVLQCQGGGRSAIAAALLQKLGRPVVFNLIGGFDAWEAAGLPVVRPEPTHA